MKKTTSLRTLSFQNYKDFFSGKGNYAGEHHFVALCLVPMLIDKILKIGNKDNLKLISYINPDGAKSITDKKKSLYDITFNGVGLEVKYSKTSSLRFTSTQLENLKGNKDFKGIIAITNVNDKGKCKIVYIEREEFYRINADKISKAFKKKSQNITIPTTSWNSCENENTFLDLFDYSFVKQHKKSA